MDLGTMIENDLFGAQLGIRVIRLIRRQYKKVLMLGEQCLQVVLSTDDHDLTDFFAIPLGFRKIR